MRKLAFAAALALVAFALPSSAAGPLLLFCSQVNGTACSPSGSTRTCSDVCGNKISCTCTSARVWRCGIEC